MIAKTPLEIRKIVKSIQYKDWNFNLQDLATRSPYFQVEFMATCARSGEVMLQRSRKWKLSKWMTKTEIVRTCYAAVRQATEHEMNESFLYMGKRIANPHMDVDALCMIADREDVRD